MLSLPLKGICSHKALPWQLWSSSPASCPLFRQEAKNLGIDRFDIILVSGDAYVDQHSFGAGLLGQVLWDAGYTVSLIAQPGQRKDFLRFGVLRLFFGITSGNMESLKRNQGVKRVQC